MSLHNKTPLIVVGTGHHFQRNLASAIARLTGEKHAEVLATIDIVSRLEKEGSFNGTRHIRRNSKLLSEQLRPFRKKDPLVILGHSNSLHARDAQDLLSHGFRVAIEKPYTHTSQSLKKVMKASKSTQCALLEYYLTTKSIPLLFGYGEIDPGSFYIKESLIQPHPGLKQFARSMSDFSGMLPKIIGSVKRIEVEVLEGEGETGTVEGRGVDTVDVKTGGGMIQDMATHPFVILFALERVIGPFSHRTDFTVRTARCKEYVKTVKRRFALPSKRIGETYAEITFTTHTKVKTLVRFGKYVFGDRNRRGVLLVGTKGRAYLDLNTCTLSVNEIPLLSIEKSYYPVIRAAIAHTEGEPIFSFDAVDVPFQAQDLVFKIQKQAYESKEDVYYASGADPKDIFRKKRKLATTVDEEDIRPDEDHDRWLEMLGEELSSYFSPQKRKEVSCPGCGSFHTESEFVKLGFVYKWCVNCFSLYASPRPSEKEIEQFYRTSSSIKFYGNKIFKPALAARYEHQIIPLSAWVQDIITKHVPTEVSVLDFMPKYFSVWAEDIHIRQEKLHLADPVHLVKIPRQAVTQTVTGSQKQKYDLITAFDVLDHRSDPEKTIKDFGNMSKQGGMLLLTLNTASGFEYQILNHDSHRLVPPNRLNLFTTEAIEQLLEKHGFEVIDVSTPGKLDVDIVFKSLLENQTKPIGRFFTYLLHKRGTNTWESLQSFLQANNLSSYLRIAARKK